MKPGDVHLRYPIYPEGLQALLPKQCGKPEALKPKPKFELGLKVFEQSFQAQSPEAQTTRPRAEESTAPHQRPQNSENPKP